MAMDDQRPGIYCFEPQAEFWGLIRALPDPVVLCPFGLGKETGGLPMFRDHRKESASLYPGKRFVSPRRVFEAPIVRATEWFQEHLQPEDHVLARMNCEGAECDILEDLAESGEIRKICGLAVVFDIKKVPGEAHREATVRRLLPRIPKVFIMHDRDAIRAGTAYLSQWMEAIK